MNACHYNVSNECKLHSEPSLHVLPKKTKSKACILSFRNPFHSKSAGMGRYVHFFVVKLFLFWLKSFCMYITFFNFTSSHGKIIQISIQFHSNKVWSIHRKSKAKSKIYSKIYKANLSVLTTKWRIFDKLDICLIYLL